MDNVLDIVNQKQADVINYESDLYASIIKSKVNEKLRPLMNNYKDHFQVILIDILNEKIGELENAQDKK